MIDLSPEAIQSQLQNPTQDMARARAAGAAFAREQFTAIRICTGGSLHPLHWWAGCMATLAGAAIAELGARAGTLMFHIVAAVGREIADQTERIVTPGGIGSKRN